MEFDYNKLKSNLENKPILVTTYDSSCDNLGLGTVKISFEKGHLEFEDGKIFFVNSKDSSHRHQYEPKQIIDDYKGFKYYSGPLLMDFTIINERK